MESSPYGATRLDPFMSKIFPVNRVLRTVDALFLIIMP